MKIDNINNFPYNVFSKEFDNFLLFVNNEIFSFTEVEFETNFLKTIQGNTKIWIGNMNTIKIDDDYILDYKANLILIDLKNYNFLVKKYLLKNDHFINGITECPSLLIGGINNDWQIYSNTIYEITIFAFQNNCIEAIKENFIHFNKTPIYSTVDEYLAVSKDYFDGSDVFKKTFTNLLNINIIKP
jgi:hypothetical protein